MLQDQSRNRTPMPAAQPPAGAAPPEPGPARAEAGIARMLASAPSPVFVLRSDVSGDLRAALDELAAAEAAGRAETRDDDEAFNVHAARQDAADDVVLATSCRSLADVGAKLTSLIPRIRPDLLNKRHADHLEAMRSDIDLMLAGPTDRALTLPDPILSMIEVWRLHDAALTAFDAQRSAGTFVGNKVEEEERLIEARAPVRDVVLATVPTTPAGRSALVRFVRAEIAASGTIEGGPPDDDHPIWRDGLRALLAAQEAEFRADAEAMHLGLGQAVRQQGASPDLVTMVNEWQALLDRINGDVLSDADVEKLSDRHGELQREICDFPAASTADLLAKVPVFRDELYDATHGLSDGCEVKDTLSGAAWLGLFRDFEHLARTDALPTAPSLIDRIIACWREWSTITDPDRTELEEREAREALGKRRYALIDAAEALPATIENLSAKALALAWIEYPAIWENGWARDDYPVDGRLALDIDTAICGRLATEA